MEISLIYVLIAAEIMFVLLGLSITFFILWLRKSAKPETQTTAEPSKDAEEELDVIDLGSNYIDFLEQAIERNSNKLHQAENNEKSDDSDADTNTEEASETAPLANSKQCVLLQAREQFLLIEKEATENTENEINFWDHIYAGMQKLVEQFATTEVVTETNTKTEVVINQKTDSKDKVFYIETQGKKIDGEVNKLKDILFEQENALSSMKKALMAAETDMPEESDAINAIKEQLAALERQLNDSKMCMEVLEMENNRLQEEVDKMDSRHDALFDADSDGAESESTSMIDIDQMKEVMAEQEDKINQLLNTIDSLEIDASQAEKLKETLGEFTRTSKDMMGCIAILEEENERLQKDAAKASASDKSETDVVEHAPSGNEEIDSLNSKISALEEDAIKKDVAFAQLQDEFSSMETEYLAMYEAMHGDNS